jgi:hypothetical protein
MSFADGLESGINLSLKISTLQLQKEQEERLKNQYQIDLIKADSDLQKNLLEAEETRLKIDDLNYKAKPKYRQRQEALTEATIDWRNAVTDDIKQSTAEAAEIAKTNKELKNWSLATEFLSSAYRWATDPEMIQLRKDNAPEWQAWQNNSLKIFQILHDSGNDIHEYFAPRYAQAQRRLGEVLEPTNPDLNLETIDLADYADDISAVFRPKLGSYLGKQYKDDMGNEGEITDIRMTGAFEAIEGGKKSLIGTQYTILTPSGETKIVEGFLPDRSQKIIRGDIEKSDAVAVSTADLIDQVAGGRHLLGTALDNPAMIEIVQEINNINSAKYFPPDQKFESLILETAEELRDDSNLEIEDKKRTINLTTFSQLPFDSDDIEDMRTVDRSLNILAQNFDGFRDYLEKKSIGNEDFLRLPKGETIDGVINKTKISIDESLRVARSLTRIPSGSSSAGVRARRTYDFTVGQNDLQISRDEKSSEFLPKLRQQYGDDIIDNAIEDIRGELSKTYDGDVMDNDFALLSELYYYLGSRRRR